ncbi:MAG: DUF6101 family protein [Ancalomicrobiaceae bacterium]|nr:DUF6101 family protein [Ancalomicrobiaceae bacterium]
MRVDPMALPQCFKYHTGLDGEAGIAAVVLDRAQAVVCRRLPSGIPMAMRMPMNVFEGVAVRMVNEADDVTIVIELLHRDPNLSVPLTVARDMDEVVADWRAWGRVLGLPLLTVDVDGSYRAVEDRLGALTIGHARPRRRRSVLAKRRPRFLMRRRMGRASEPTVRIAEREISSWE